MTAAYSRKKAALADEISLTWFRLAKPRWSDALIEQPPDAWIVPFSPDRAECESSPLLLGIPSDEYDPIAEEPGLFRTFADLDGSREALAGFAEKYGPLQPVSVIEREESVVMFGESDAWSLEKAGYLEEWWSALAGMQSAVTLWDALRTGQPGSVIGGELLIDVVPTWEPVGDFVQVAFAPESFLVAGPTAMRADTEVPAPHREKPAALLPARDPSGVPLEVRAVRVALGAVVTGYAQKLGVTPSLRDVGDRYGTGMRLGFSAPDLEGAMWLQLILAIDGNRRIEKCEECGHYWDATDARSHKETCSDKCRQRRKRRLDKEAQEGASDG